MKAASERAKNRPYLMHHQMVAYGATDFFEEK